jgi:hypothetical protein
VGGNIELTRPVEVLKKDDDRERIRAIARGREGRPGVWRTILMLTGLVAFVWLIGWSGLANLD